MYIALIKSSATNEYLGMVSDRRLLAWFASYALRTPSLHTFLSNSLHSFSLPSLNLYDAVVASTANSTVLDAMMLMSEGGVSSVAVLDDDTGTLLSAVSVTDIGKVRPAQIFHQKCHSTSDSDRCPFRKQTYLVHTPAPVCFLHQSENTTSI